MKKRGKIIKMFLPIFLSVMLIFNAAIPPKKTQAVAPLLVWAAEALIAEVVVDLGWKYVGKPALKKITNKLSKKMMDNPNAFDFMKKKPKVDGQKKKVDIDVSPLDRAKVASLLKEEFKEIKKADTDRKQKTTNPVLEVSYAETDPLYNTGVKFNYVPHESSTQPGMNKMALDFFSRFYDVILTPNAYKESTNVKYRNIVTGDIVDDGNYKGGTPYSERTLTLEYSGTCTYYCIRVKFNTYATTLTSVTDPAWKIYQAYLRQIELNNRTIYMADGVTVPEDNTKIYDVPLNTPSGTKLPNSNDIDIDLSIPIDIDNDNVLEVEWEDLDIYQKYFQDYITNVENKGDITINNYENITYVTNIYYQSDPYDKTPEEVCKEINCDGETNPPTDPEEEDDDSIWKDIIPIALVIVLFDLLSSILMYLARMFQFILTIPVIPEKPIDNSAFQWFKTAKIMGVQIYNVVSMLATVGLSFLAFKAIRKVLP